MQSLDKLANANSRQLGEAKRLGWKSLFWNCHTSPNMGKWKGHRCRLYGFSPEGSSEAIIVPDFFQEVERALDETYPL